MSFLKNLSAPGLADAMTAIVAKSAVVSAAFLVTSLALAEDSSLFARGGPNPCGGATVLIHEIQGAGDQSPCVGVTVTVEGVVTGDYEGPAPALRGFYLQEEESDQDADAQTSEGIFVFHGDLDLVALGDLVQVTAEVQEVEGQTQLSFPQALDVLGGGNSLAPTPLSLPLETSEELEAVEGMLVVYEQTLYVTEYFQLGRFGQVVVSSGDRLYQPTSVAEPGDAANAVLAANALNRLIIDDGLNGQNPDPIVFGRGGEELTAANTLRGGDTATGTVGVMTYTWAGNAASGNAFRLRPINALGGYIEFQATNPRPLAPPAVGGTLQVGAFNVLNYYRTLDTAQNSCGPGLNVRCRGADTAEELNRQRAKLIAAMAKLDAEVVGLVELENTPAVSPEQDIVAGLNDLLGATEYAFIDAASQAGGVVGPDVIRVGLVYQPGRVTPVGNPALLEFSRDSFGIIRSRTALAQSFLDNSAGVVFTVVVNHFKSKSGAELDDPGGECLTNPNYPDCDQGDGQRFFNATRTVHAQELLAWLDTDPTSSGSANFLILGDLNAYAMEDPIRAITDAGYQNLAGGEGTYSFSFGGQLGNLDYALASPTLAEAVSDGAVYHINADEPPVLDYNTEFKSAKQLISLYAADEYRTSDHDPIVVGLALDFVILSSDFELLEDD